MSVREKTFGERLEALSKQLDAFKTIAIILGGALVVILGWFGISLTRKTQMDT